MYVSPPAARIALMRCLPKTCQLARIQHARHLSPEVAGIENLLSVTLCWRHTCTSNSLLPDGRSNLVMSSEKPS